MIQVFWNIGLHQQSIVIEILYHYFLILLTWFIYMENFDAYFSTSASLRRDENESFDYIYAHVLSMFSNMYSIIILQNIIQPFNNFRFYSTSNYLATHL